MANYYAAAASRSAVVQDDDYEVDDVRYYLVSMDGPEGAWQVRRRYNDFGRLHDELSERQVLLPPMPRKSIFRISVSKRFREARRAQLQHVLQVALQSDPCLQHLELRAFVGLIPAASASALPFGPQVVLVAAPAGYAQVCDPPAQDHTYSSGQVAAAAVGGAAVALVGGMMLESALEHRDRDVVVEDILGTETIVETTSPHGFFGSEQVTEEVHTDIFGDTEVRTEIVDRDMFGRVTDVREEVTVIDSDGDTTESEDDY